MQAAGRWQAAGLQVFEFPVKEEGLGSFLLLSGYDARGSGTNEMDSGWWWIYDTGCRPDRVSVDDGSRTLNY